MDRPEAIRTRLQQALAPSALEIIDDSHLHAGHPGARGGGGHFTVQIVAERFAEMNSIQRHQAVYAAVADLMPAEIHALSIQARAPGETS